MAELTDREERTCHDAIRRSVRARTSSPRCAAAAWRFWRGTGTGHRLLPSELNFRANIYGFKVLGVEWILSASAVGSLREDYKPLDLVVPDQFFDRTRGRVSTFFGDGLVGHVAFAHPFCGPLSGDHGRVGDRRPARRCTRAARTCAWKGRSFRRSRSPTPTARPASTSSA